MACSDLGVETFTPVALTLIDLWPSGIYVFTDMRPQRHQAQQGKAIIIHGQS